MTEDTTAGAGQAPTDASTVTQAVTPTTSTEPQAGESPEDYKRMIAELRKESAAYRTKLKAHEEAQAAAELAKLGDLEKATAQLEKAQKQVKDLRDENVKAQIRLQAKTLGIANDELIAPYVLTKLEYDDDGKPTNLDKILDEIIKSNPNIRPENATSAAQTANARQAPTTPANNPGRSQIVQPGQIPAGQRVTFHDLQWKK